MIGIIGGYGNVGLQAARMLAKWGKQPLRLGGRNAETARARLGAEFSQAEWVTVDIEDDRSLEAFLKDCQLIVNCAGPSCRTAARVAGMCLSTGCHQVEAGAGESLDRMRGTPQRTVVLYAAGATPGLSGLLPRWLAKCFERVDSLLCYTGAFDRFTASAAEDYFAGLASNGNKPLAAWKNGVCRSSALQRKSKAQLPFFPREVTLYPYFDAEAEFVAASLSLRDGEWYMAMDGAHAPAVLEAACAQFLTDRNGAVRRLCTASGLDLAGRQAYMNIIVQLRGMKNGAEMTRTLVLQADSPVRLTGSVAAAAGIAVLEGTIPPGVWPLAEIPDPAPVLDWLYPARSTNRLAVLEHSVEDLLQAVEGEL